MSVQASTLNLQTPIITLNPWRSRTLAVWRDADPDIPILNQAKAEYAKLR
jgi:hypothetical protein